MLLFLYERIGGRFVAPYLDKYGEPDPYLRRGQQLFLNQQRYDKLVRDLWLGHQLPSTIGRQFDVSQIAQWMLV